MGKLIPALLLIVCFQLHSSFALSTDSLGAKINLPQFNAQIGIGFNYDLLRDPTDVSFEYPKAFFGFNVPLKGSVNLRNYTYLQPGIDSIFNDTSMISNGEEFKPTGSARQNANATVRVEVPMLGGVGSFSNIQNVYLNYQNVLGNPDILVDPKNLGDGVSFLLKGTVNVPMDLTLYWETMTFGYAYKLNKFFTFAFNLHRHVFSLDMQGKIDVDIMGRYKIDLSSQGGSSGVEIPSIDGVIDYPSDKVYGSAYGHFETEAWSPTLAIKAWRFSLVSRFGIDKRAKGEFYAKYSIPFFIDPETFGLKYDFQDPKTLTDPEVTNGLSTNAIDSVNYSSGEADLIWKMPTALTLSFDVWPKHLRISYSKLYGEIRMKLDKISKVQKASESGSIRDSTSDSAVIDIGVNVDHVILMQCNLFNSFLNVGVCAFDVEYGDQKHLIGKNMPYLTMGESAMLPVLNMGTALGTKLQLLLELDILPLPALKTGIFYYF
jgi:hypothetical protein